MSNSRALGSLSYKNLVAILIAIILTSLIWLIILQDDRYKRLREEEKNVWLPMREILHDLEKTGKSGESETLLMKVNALRIKWDEYINKGTPPGEFSDKIIHIGSSKEDTEGTKTKE